MSIEAHILQLIAAIDNNTQALRDVLAASASTTPAPAKEKKTKAAKAEETPTPAPEPAEEPKTAEAPPVVGTTTSVVEETPEPEPATEEPTVHFVDKDDFIAKVTAHVQGVFAAAGNNIGGKKGTYTAIREEFGIKTAKELDEDKWVAFWERIQSL